jgi:hypothetical protein
MNEAIMQTRALKIETNGRQARSVLDCGSPLPLLNRGKDSALQSARGLAQSKTWRIFGTLLTVLAVAISVRAQSYSVDWYKIAGGGGTSTGEPMIGVNYSVSGTIGQPDAGGAMTGGNYSVTGGFWSLYAVQTPDAPLLTITHIGNQAIISWLPSVTGWTLQTNVNLATPTWGNYLGPIVNNSVTNLPPKGNVFFRLKNP